MTTPVPLLDLAAIHNPLRDEIFSAIAAVIDSQHFILGPRVKELEEAIAHYTGVPYAVSCASGSDALLLALMALGIKGGDKVITSPYSFFATAGAIVRVGAEPVFVDVVEDEFNLDPARVEEYLAGLSAAERGQVRAIIPVHLYGRCASMTRLRAIGDAYGIPVIEDAAQALGASHQGKKAGAWGQIGCFSFFPSKNLGGFGDGGIITTDDPDLAQKLQILRVHGAMPKYYHQVLGINSRLDALQAAVLLIKLKHLDKWSAQRRNNAEKYRQLLAGLPGLKLPADDPHGYHVYNQFALVTDKRDALRTFLSDRHIGTEIYYPVPLHKQPCFQAYQPVAGCPNAERLALTSLAIPISPGLADEQLAYVTESIREFMKQ